MKNRNSTENIIIHSQLACLCPFCYHRSKQRIGRAQLMAHDMHEESRALGAATKLVGRGSEENNWTQRCLWFAAACGDSPPGAPGSAPVRSPPPCWPPAAPRATRAQQKVFLLAARARARARGRSRFQSAEGPRTLRVCRIHLCSVDAMPVKRRNTNRHGGRFSKPAEFTEGMLCTGQPQVFAILPPSISLGVLTAINFAIVVVVVLARVDVGRPRVCVCVRVPVAAAWPRRGSARTRCRKEPRAHSARAGMCPGLPGQTCPMADERTKKEDGGDDEEEKKKKEKDIGEGDDISPLKLPISSRSQFLLKRTKEEEERKKKILKKATTSHR